MSPLLTRFATEFSRTGRDAAGRCVHVRVVPKASGAAMGDLAKGWPTEPEPDVWTPSGSIWLPLLEARLASQQQSSLVPAPASAPSVAASARVARATGGAGYVAQGPAEIQKAYAAALSNV